MGNARTAHQAQLAESIKQFLTEHSITKATESHCSECGAELLYLRSKFWLRGEEQEWKIRLPYCPVCHPLPKEQGNQAA